MSFSAASYYFLLSTLFSNTNNLRSSLNVRDQISHPFKTTGQISFVSFFYFTFLPFLPIPFLPLILGIYVWKMKETNSNYEQFIILQL
jgi:hypothetical protein